MTELSRKAQDILAESRGAHDPSEDDFARVHAAFAAQLAAGAGAADTGASLDAGALAAKGAAVKGGATLFGAAKIVGVCSALIVGGTTYHALREPGTETRRASSHEAAATTVRPVAAPTAVAETPAANEAAPFDSAAHGLRERAQGRPGASEGATGLAALTARHPSREGARARAARASAPPSDGSATPEAAPVTRAQSAPELVPPEPTVPAQPPPQGVGAAELTLLREALTQLSAGKAGKALATLVEHRARYPQSALDQERRGLRVLALCASGDMAQGSSEQRAFLASDGSSPLARRVRSACSGEP